jgi:transcriptional regulator with XRE-family HTH domain
MASPIESTIQFMTPSEAQRALADRVRDARIGLSLKQTTLAARAGVTLATLRRFEQKGEIALKYLMRICHALGRVDEFDAILRPPAAATMAELESRVTRPARKRGSR